MSEQAFAIRDATAADAAAIARVHVATWQSAYRGVLPDEFDEFLDGMSVPERTAMWTQVLTAPPGSAAWRIVLVAEAREAGIVAFASAGPASEPGYAAELHTLYVLPEWQGRGVGRMLMAAIAGWLADAGWGSLCCWVLAGGPAVPFYEHLGGRFLRADRQTLFGQPMDVVAYGWPDTAALRRLTARQGPEANADG